MCMHICISMYKLGWQVKEALLRKNEMSRSEEEGRMGGLIEEAGSVPGPEAGLVFRIAVMECIRLGTK